MISSEIEDPPIHFADVERSQYQGVWNSIALRRLKREKLPKNENVVIGKCVRKWKTDDRGNVISQNLGR